VIHEILIIANSVIGKSSLPDFSFAAEDRTEGVRVSALDELDCMFERHVVGGSQQEVDMFRHNDESVQLITAFATISVESLQEEAHVVFDNEEPSTLPDRKSYEIGSGRGDEWSRLQEQTSAAKAAVFV
jgi:hypothetical protein